MSIKLSSEDQECALQYMEQWFWNISSLAQAADVNENVVNEMILEGCIPGTIYSFDLEYGWWSALAAYMGQASSTAPDDGKMWYSPATLWWIRRTVLHLPTGKSLAEISRELETTFEKEFVALLKVIPNANSAYPDGYSSDGVLDNHKAHQIAQDEWRSWICGAYGVCLRDFAANNCIRKEVFGALLKTHFEEGSASRLTDLEVLAMTQELASLVTPFAPWERPTGTPGKTIDVALCRFKLGSDYPYPFPIPASK